LSTDPLPLAQALIRCASVTPVDAGALAVLEAALTPLGFACRRLRFGEVDNLFATRGAGAPHLCYAGHTDVVPPGDRAAWTDDPFAAVVRDSVLYGRGACDMKGGIAAFVAAVADLPPEHPGTLSLLITGDEEGPARDGTARVLETLAAQSALPDCALVGEPTSRARVGDVIKIGRRGSLTARITVHGTQGHSAYPERADNPIHRLVAALHALTAAPLDAGSAHFAPSTLQVTGFDVGNAASNVIPAAARAVVNIRFNDQHSSRSLRTRLAAVLAEHAPRHKLDVECSGESFFTPPGAFVDALRAAAGGDVALDTGGGTSDARFFARHGVPVAELGGVGATLHAVDECVPVAELRELAALYGRVLREVLRA